MKNKMLKRILALIIACAMVCAICVVPEKTANAATSKTPVATHGRLSVKGADLVDSHGKKVQLRGISTHGINWDVGAPYVNKAAFKTLRDDWGVNAIRLAMYTSEYNGYCAGGDKNSLVKLVDKGVKYAKELGMYVIIDWHILNDGNPMTNISEAKKFFNRMAKKYKNTKNVIYEICNEPNGTDWNTIKTYSKQIYKVIRKHDKKAVIIVGTPTWSQLGSDGTSNEVADSPLTGVKNVMYSLHFYANEWSHNEYLPAKVKYARSKNVPIFVSEFGLSSANGNDGISTSNANKWFKLLNKYNISYFCWSITNKNETASLLKSTTTKTSNWKVGDLSAAGKYIRSKYRKRRNK